MGSACHSGGKAMPNPHRICSLIGHKCAHRKEGEYTDHRGRWRERWRPYCTRCGSDDLGTIYERGLLQVDWRSWRWAFKEWRREDCPCCRKPMVRFGRRVGNHKACDDGIPF